VQKNEQKKEQKKGKKNRDPDPDSKFKIVMAHRGG
jgi:hypothetical protein